MRQVDAVDEDVVGDDSVGGRAQADERVEELVVAIEGAVDDHQRHVAVATRQPERGVEAVVDDPHSGQAAPDVASGVVEAMVVVPLEGGAFGAAVLAQVVDVGLLRARLDQQVVAGAARRQSLWNLAVEGVRLGAGQASGLAVELAAVVAAVQVDAQLAGVVGQTVLEGDLGALSRRAPDRRPRKGAVVGPHPGLRAGKGLDLGLAHDYLDPRVADLPGYRQGGLEGGRARRRRLSRGAARPGAEQPPSLPRRQQDGERAAAQDAEKIAAPQAGRG